MGIGFVFVASLHCTFASYCIGVCVCVKPAITKTRLVEQCGFVLRVTRGRVLDIERVGALRDCCRRG